jgi:hypothetical protein
MRTHTCQKCRRYFQTSDANALVCKDCDPCAEFDAMEIYICEDKYHGKVSPALWVDLKMHKFLWFYYFTVTSHKYMVMSEHGFTRIL